MAAPGTDKTDQSAKSEGTPVEKEPAPAAAPAATPKPTPAATSKPAPTATPAPVKRRGGLLSKLFLTLIVALMVLGIAGYGALIFRDADPRVGVAANYVDNGLKEAQRALDEAQSTIAGLMGESPKPTNSKIATHRTAAPPQPGDAKPAVESVEKAPEPAPLEAAKEPEAPVAPPPPAAAEAPVATAPEPPRRPAEIAQEPAPTPAPVEAAKPAAPATRMEARDADGFSDRDLISALEGRIEAMSNELMAVRARLDAPKSETRAAPEAEVAKSEAAKPAVADGAATAVVVAFALQKDLESGRPYAEEIGALSRLGTEPAPVLAEFAEKGAPTGAQLRETFLPVAKKLKATAAHAEDHGDLAGHLLQGASKLVKVRPTGQAEPETVDGKLDRIDAALTHNDFAAADGLFESLPEAEKAEAKSFGDALRQRAEASKAADDLLHGAIAAIGSRK
jgi:hypothetical protein